MEIPDSLLLLPFPRRLANEGDPLWMAVFNNDLEALKALIESGQKSVNTIIIGTYCVSLLCTVIRHRRVEMFDYLLSLKETDLNFTDGSGRTALMYLANNYYGLGCESYVLKLIDKGANVYILDAMGNSFLHYIVEYGKDGSSDICTKLIEKEIDLNYQTRRGCTPLYQACQAGNFDWIYMLLYHGADPTIPSNEGFLPLTVFCDLSTDNPDKQLVEEILFQYTFDHFKITIPLKILHGAMTINSPLFCKMLDQVNDVSYNEEDLHHMATELFKVKAKHFKIFLERFGCIVKDLVEKYPLLDMITSRNVRELLTLETKEVMEIFVESEFVSEFIQASSTTYIISVLTVLFRQDEFSRLCKVIYLMLTYGLRVSSVDLDSIYDGYGFCELLKNLLHMDIEIEIDEDEERSMAVMFYEPQMTIADILEQVALCPQMLLYFNNQKLKNYISGYKSDKFHLLTSLCCSCCISNLPRNIHEVWNANTIDEKLKQMPDVPLLVELSRNVARQYIIEKFNIKNSRQFYTVLRCLPIGEINKKIIALEKVLY